MNKFRYWLVWLFVMLANRLMNPVKVSMGCDCGKCGYNCAYVEPYGFVPECGCPVHDDDSTVYPTDTTKPLCGKCDIICCCDEIIAFDGGIVF